MCGGMGGGGGGTAAAAAAAAAPSPPPLPLPSAVERLQKSPPLPLFAASPPPFAFPPAPPPPFASESLSPAVSGAGVPVLLEEGFEEGEKESCLLVS